MFPPSCRKHPRSWGSPSSCRPGWGRDYTWRRSQTFLPAWTGTCTCQCWALVGTKHHLLHSQPSAQRVHPTALGTRGPHSPFLEVSKLQPKIIHSQPPWGHMCRKLTRPLLSLRSHVLVALNCSAGCDPESHLQALSTLNQLRMAPARHPRGAPSQDRPRRDRGGRNQAPSSGGACPGARQQLQ